MSLRSLLLLLVGAAIVAFIGVNWSAMTVPTDLNLIFTEIRAPLGLVLLGLMALLSAVFVGLIAYTQGTVLMETRRHAKELSAQRELADKAEASRFTELRTVLELRHQEAQQQLLNRLDALEEQFKARAQESDNSTAAYVGQLEQQLRAGVAADWGSGKGHAAKPAEGRADPLL